MSEENKIYIGSGKLKSTAKNKVKLVLADKSVTINKLADEVLRLISSSEGGVNHIFITQEDYDALDSYVTNALYFIVPEGAIPVPPTPSDVWHFGDTFPIRFYSDVWTFGSSFPITLV